jgi:hypothetical protein
VGNGVPNQGHIGHFEGGTLVGYILFYHDQMVTGNDWKPSLQISTAAYADLHAAAQNGQQAFETELATTAWHSFFGVYAVSKTALRAGVLKVSP